VEASSTTGRPRRTHPTLKSTRAQLDIITAYQELGSYRAAAKLCGTTDKTVKQIVERQQLGQLASRTPPRPVHNTDSVRDLIHQRPGPAPIANARHDDHPSCSQRSSLPPREGDGHVAASASGSGPTPAVFEIHSRMSGLRHRSFAPRPSRRQVSVLQTPPPSASCTPSR
jgi:hypothetical protein